MNSISPLLPKVRVAGPVDEQEIYRLLLLANAENALQEHDNAKVQWFVKRFVNGDKIPFWDPDPRGIIGVIGPVGGRLEGLSMIGIGTFWYSKKRHLEEYVVFVDPEHRRHGVGRARALIEWNKGQAAETGLKILTGVISNHRTAAKVRLYGRELGEPAGVYFVWPAQYHADVVTGPGRRTGSYTQAVATARERATVVASSSKAA